MLAHVESPSFIVTTDRLQIMPLALGFNLSKLAAIYTVDHYFRHGPTSERFVESRLNPTSVHCIYVLATGVLGIL